MADCRIMHQWRYLQLVGGTLHLHYGTMMCRCTCNMYFICFRCVSCATVRLPMFFQPRHITSQWSQGPPAKHSQDRFTAATITAYQRARALFSFLAPSEPSGEGSGDPITGPHGLICQKEGEDSQAARYRGQTGPPSRQAHQPVPI